MVDRCSHFRIAGHVDNAGAHRRVELIDLVVGDDLVVQSEAFDERSVPGRQQAERAR